MNRKSFAFIVIFLFACVCLHAERSGLVDTGWQSMSTDSVRPWCTFGIKLQGDWRDSVYSASIEYPQLHKINPDDLGRWNINDSEIPSWPDIKTSFGITRSDALFNAGFLPVIKRNGDYWAILSYKWIVRSKAVSTRTATRLVSPKDRYTHTSQLSDGKWVKIRIDKTGVYRLSYTTLRSMGFSDPSKVRLFGYGGAVLPETNLAELTDDLPEQPMWRGSNYLLFYAKGPVSWRKSDTGYLHEVNTYSDWGYYFLTDKADVPAASFVALEADTMPGKLIDTYMDHTVYDPDEYSWYRSGRRLFENHDYSTGDRSYNFDLKGLASDTVGLRVAFASASDKAAKLAVKVNGTGIGELYMRAMFSGESAVLSESSMVSRGVFKEQNTIRLEYNATTGSGRLDYISLNYKRRLAMYGPCTLFRVESDQENVSFSIEGSDENVQVWRISADGSYGIVPSIYYDSRTVTMSASYNASDILLAVNVKGSFPEPENMGPVANQNLHALDSVRMVIVVPSSGHLTAQAERLADAHRKLDTMNVAVVRADMVYNEFSSGTPDATALRRFMKMLYDRSDEASAPRYLLLMGNGAWDNRMHVSDWKGQDPDDYLLCYESYESLSHTESYVMEDYFGLLDDQDGENLMTDLVDLGVGRLAVGNARQAKAEVDQIIDYMSGTYSGTWNNRILVLGDDGDNNIHMSDADKVADIYQNNMSGSDIRKIYWDTFKMEVSASYNGYPSIRRLLSEQFEEGALIINYIGHGSTESLSHELVFSKSDMKDLHSDHLPFWITASCDISPFDSPLESLGMNLISCSEGGAIGMLATTRTVYASLNGVMNRSFSHYVTSRSADGRMNSVGDALRLAKNELVTPGVGESDYSTNKIHFVLLGDPAMRLAVPDLKVVVDSFGGQDASVTSQVKAGSVISVKGHVECNGERLSSYRGLLSSVLYDSEREITCRNNLKTADEPFTFKTRDRVLYSGADSVRNGEFTISIPVPMDINYSDQSGEIIWYVNGNDGRNANGSFSNFTLGGTETDIRADSTGPKIGLYLNTPSFQYGQTVNSTPMLVVELSDSSGLNTSGNGLGHDILLVIDNDPNKTWVLNSYFRQTEGDYTSGRVMFNIPELSDGKHEIMLRAWDMMNNSSTVYLMFRVVSDLKPTFTIDVTASPARERTSFVITHDRPGTDTDVTIQVASSDGTLQWVKTCKDESGTGVTVVDWNLCSNSGHRMQPGLYLIRATVSSGGSGSSASCKMVIVGP